MNFQPTYQFQLIPDQDYLTRIPDIEQTLSAYATQGFITSFDGCKLAYELYLADNSTATIIIVHGLSEFYPKYYEMTWYFLNMGFNVLLYDQRGHGLSDRKVDKLSLVHVDYFDDYVKDLHSIYEQAALPLCPKVPVYLFAHSMGGAVAALYLAAYPSTVNRAVLSSPMICPVTSNVPLFFAKLHAHHLMNTKGWTDIFPFGRDFDPNVQVTASNDLSYGRFKHNLDYRIQHEIYQTSLTTNRWMWEALQMQRRLLSTNITKKITADILLLSAGEDHTVKLPPQQRFAAKISSCKLVTFPRSKHTIYTATDDILMEYYTMILEYLRIGNESFHSII